MRLSRTLALLTALSIATALATAANAATLSLVGSSLKVCQLIGETDWATGAPTAAKTASNFGLDAVDLGFPVDSGVGPLFFLFGDTIPDAAAPFNPIPPNDAIGFTARRAPPDGSDCVNLQLIVSAPKVFANPTVSPPIEQGDFNVPTGGVFVDDKFYAFFWTNHCVFATPLLPDPSVPLALPPANPPFCLEIPLNNSVGASVLAEGEPGQPARFAAKTTLPSIDPVHAMPSGFVYASAAKRPFEFEHWFGDERREAAPVFGAARYRASIPYLAMAPRESFGNPRSWKFFAGLSGGKPTWLTRDEWEAGHNASGQWTPPAGAEIFAPALPGDRCVGEHSVTWNEPLKKWLLLYNCDAPGGLPASGFGVQARFAPEPWGPWSPPVTLLNSVQDPGVLRTLIMKPLSSGGCPSLAAVPPGRTDAGFFYAPFVMNRFTQDLTASGHGQPKRAKIYWVVSTWNPYYVVVMQSTLELN